jgi:hypothetical protein
MKFLATIETPQGKIGLDAQTGQWAGPRLLSVVANSIGSLRMAGAEIGSPIRWAADQVNKLLNGKVVIDDTFNHSPAEVYSAFQDLQSANDQDPIVDRFMAEALGLTVEQYERRRARNSPGQLSLWDDPATESNLLRTSARQKSLWDEDSHPRHPAGTGEGGQFAPREGSGAGGAEAQVRTEPKPERPPGGPTSPPPPKKPEKNEGASINEHGVPVITHEEIGSGLDGSYDRLHSGLASEIVQSKIAIGMKGIEGREYAIIKAAGGKYQLASRPGVKPGSEEEKLREILKNAYKKAGKVYTGSAENDQRLVDLARKSSEHSKEESKASSELKAIREGKSGSWWKKFDSISKKEDIDNARKANERNPPKVKGFQSIDYEEREARDNALRLARIAYDEGRAMGKIASEIHPQDYGKWDALIGYFQPEPKKEDQPRKPPKGFNFKNHVKIAADSIESLRKSDVSRLVESTPNPETAQFVADEIGRLRPDLKSEADESIYDFMKEVGGKYSAVDAWVDRFMADLLGITVEQYAARKVKSSPGQQMFDWITVHPNGAGTKGVPVMIDRKDGTIKAGMGGKFDGMKIGEIGKAGGAKPAEKAAEGKPAESGKPAAEAEKPASGRFIVVSKRQGRFEAEDHTDDIVDFKSKRPMGFYKYYDTQTGEWVQPGKRGPVKDKNNRPQYQEVPTSIENILDGSHEQTIAERKGQFAESDDEFSDFDKSQHRKQVRMAMAMGKPVRPEVLADYPDIAPKTSVAKTETQTTPEAADLQARDRFTDSTGQEYEVFKSRFGTVVAHPVINGKPQVNRDSGVTFAINDTAKAKNPDHRTDIKSVSKWQNPDAKGAGKAASAGLESHLKSIGVSDADIAKVNAATKGKDGVAIVNNGKVSFVDAFSLAAGGSRDPEKMLDELKSKRGQKFVVKNATAERKAESSNYESRVAKEGEWDSGNLTDQQRQTLESLVSKGVLTKRKGTADEMTANGIPTVYEPAPAKPAPAPSSFTPEMIPGQQASLFGGDDLNTGQKSLFNMVRPTKADQRAAKRDAGPAPASLLEQIDDEQRKVADSRKSLPGQRDLLAGDGGGSAAMGGESQFKPIAEIRTAMKGKLDQAEAKFNALEKSLISQKSKSKSKSVRDGLDNQYREAKEAAQEERQRIIREYQPQLMDPNHPEVKAQREKDRAYLESRRSQENQRAAEGEGEAKREAIAKINSQGGFATVIQELEKELIQLQGRLKRTGDTNKWKLDSNVKNLERQIASVKALQDEKPSQFSTAQLDRFIERYRAGSSAKKSDTKPKTVTGSKGDRGRFITVGEGEEARKVFLPGSVKRIKETGEYRTDNSQEKAKAARKKAKTTGLKQFVPVTKLEKSIVEKVGNHATDVKEFRKIVDRTYSEMVSEAQDRLSAIREVMAFTGYGRNAGAFINQIKAARDYDKIPRFDQAAEFAQKNYPHILAPKMKGAGGDVEGALFALLRDGMPETPTKDSPEVINAAWDRSDWDRMGMPSEWEADREERQKEDDFVPFSALGTARVEQFSAVNRSRYGAPQYARIG